MEEVKERRKKMAIVDKEEQTSNQGSPLFLLFIYLKVFSLIAAAQSRCMYACRAYTLERGILFFSSLFPLS